MSDYYVVDEDKEIIGRWADAEEVSITFREAGEFSVARLQEGAGAKPHKILEKTIKYGRGGDAGIELLQKHFPREIADSLMGLVGVWNGGKVEGLYLTTIGELEFMDTKFIDYKPAPFGMRLPYLKINTEEAVGFLIDKYNQEITNHKEYGKYFFARCFFTGDYDLHDLYIKGRKPNFGEDEELLQRLKEQLIEGRYQQLSKKYNNKNISFFETQEELKKKYTEEAVNKVVGRMNEERERYFRYHSKSCQEYSIEQLVREDYQRVQHGPQSLYVQQMIIENEEFINVIDDIINDGIQTPDEIKSDYMAWFNRLVVSVAKSSFPVKGYFCEPQKWALITDITNYKDYDLLPNFDWVGNQDEVYSGIIENSKRILRQAVLVVLKIRAHEKKSTSPGNVRDELRGLKQSFMAELSQMGNTLLLHQMYYQMLNEIVFDLC